MLRPLCGWIALAALWAGGAVAAQPMELTEAEQAALAACFQIEDDAAVPACIEDLQLPLPPEGRELLAMASDTGLQAAHERWQQGFDAAMLDHAQTLAARGDARSLLAAALIVPIRHDEATEQPLPDTVDPAAWFDTARAVRPADPLVAWLETTGCMVPRLTCDANAAIARLLQVDGDNAAVQWRAINAALDGGDEIAARTHLRLAAQAGRFQPYAGDLLTLLLESHNAAPLPPMDADTARVVGLIHRLDRPATNADVVAMLSAAQWAAAALPAMAGVMQLCDPDGRDHDPKLRQDCIAFLAKVAADESMVTFPAIALPRLVELTHGPQRAAWQSQLRDHTWIIEQYASSLAGGADADFPYRVAADGELEAIRHQMQDSGIPIQPPADWLPRNPRTRALVTTGRAPAS